MSAGPYANYQPPGNNQRGVSFTDMNRPNTGKGASVTTLKGDYVTLVERSNITFPNEALHLPEDIRQNLRERVGTVVPLLNRHTPVNSTITPYTYKGTNQVNATITEGPRGTAFEGSKTSYSPIVGIVGGLTQNVSSSSFNVAPNYEQEDQRRQQQMQEDQRRQQQMQEDQRRQQQMQQQQMQQQMQEDQRRQQQMQEDQRRQQQMQQQMQQKPYIAPRVPSLLKHFPNVNWSDYYEAFEKEKFLDKLYTDIMNFHQHVLNDKNYREDTERDIALVKQEIGLPN